MKTPPIAGRSVSPNGPEAPSAKSVHSKKPLEIQLNPDQFLHDFEDGRGLVPAYRHPNGGGIVEHPENVNPNVWLGLFVEVFGNAKVPSEEVQALGRIRVHGDSVVKDRVSILGTLEKGVDIKDTTLSGSTHAFGNGLKINDCLDHHDEYLYPGKNR